jgi:predicted PurR-regulated permease PerM
VIAALAAVLVGLALLLVPAIVSQGRALVAEAPALWQKVQHAPWFVRLDARLHLQEQLRESGPAAMGAVNPLLAAIGGVVSAVGGLLAFLFLTIFMLVFGGDLVTALLAELKPASRERYERMTAKLYRSVGGYLGGLLGICALNATLTTIFLVIVRVPFFLPLGILSGSSSLVPYAGPLVAGVIITVFALVTGGVWIALATAIYFVVYGQLEGNVLAPFVYRRTVHVNPLVTLLAILFLADFMGVAGAVVAVPVAAAAQIVVAELVAIRRDQVRRDENAGLPG